MKGGWVCREPCWPPVFLKEIKIKKKKNKKRGLLKHFLFFRFQTTIMEKNRIWKLSCIWTLYFPPVSRRVCSITEYRQGANVFPVFSFPRFRRSILFSFASVLYIAAEASGFSLIFDVTSSFYSVSSGDREKTLLGASWSCWFHLVFKLRFSAFDKCSSLRFARRLMGK